MPIESFVTTLIHWTFFSDDANKVGICWLCRSGQLHVTPSSRWSLPRCHRSVRNDMRLFLRTKQYPVQLRTTKFWKVLPQNFSVLQSTTPESTTPVLQSTNPVLFRTTKYYSILQTTTPVLLRIVVLLQYYSVLQSTSPVLQSTTPVLLRTTKYYSSTTSYYKVLVQYYFVLQSTSPELLRTTKYYSSTTKWLACLIIITYETSFTMRRAAGVTIQPHQILRLSRRKTHLLNHHYIWDLIYNARSNRCHDPTSPNTAPVMQKDSLT